MNVLSLFDGMSCGQIALKKLGITPENYFAGEIKSHAMKVAQENFPNTQQLGDVTKIDVSKLPPIDLFIGGSPCFIPGTEVITYDGVKKIEDVVVGDEVLTHKLQFKKVLKVGWAIKDIVELIPTASTLTSRVTGTTEEHPYYIRSKNADGSFDAPKWVEVIDLDIFKDYIGYPTNHYNEKLHTEDTFVEDGIAWCPIQSLSFTGEVDRVHNIEVEDDNSYTANGIIVHNCQDFSQANRERKGVDGIKSGLFWTYVRLLKEANPKYFLLENVKMKKEHEAVVSEAMGCEPIKINSQLISGQLRNRLYWTNIPGIEMPDDKGILLQSLLTSGWTDRVKARALLESDSRPLSTPVKMFHRYYAKGFTTVVFKDQAHYLGCKAHYDANHKGKPAKEITESDPVYDGIRYLNKIELERLQTVPSGYTDSLTRNEAACLLGDGWTVDVIKHIFSFMEL